MEWFPGPKMETVRLELRVIGPCAIPTTASAIKAHQPWVGDMPWRRMRHDSQRYTVDVDGLVLDGHKHLMKAVHEVARRRGLLSSWFNEQAAQFISESEDRRQLVVFDHPALRVFAASPEHLFAMKILASRPDDVDDIRTLSGILGINTREGAVAVVGGVFPCETLNERSRRTIDRIFPASREE